MNLTEIVEDLRVCEKLLKKHLKRLEKVQNGVKKVEEFNALTDELKKTEHALNLLHSTIWILKK